VGTSHVQPSKQTTTLVHVARVKPVGFSNQQAAQLAMQKVIEGGKAA
jgi:hypothetical protein